MGPFGQSQHVEARRTRARLFGRTYGRGDQLGQCAFSYEAASKYLHLGCAGGEGTDAFYSSVGHRVPRQATFPTQLAKRP
jgi:hypothetical protein